jgi:hypothetical protein
MVTAFNLCFQIQLAPLHHGSVHLTVTHDMYPDGAPRCMFAISDTGSGVNSAGSPDAREAPFHPRQCGQVHVTQGAW